MRNTWLAIVAVILIGGGALYVGNLLAGQTPASAPSDPVVSTTPAEARTVEMVARQWSFEPSEVRVRVGERVRFIVRNVDVAHGIAIPELGVNELLPPGTTRAVEFTASRPGSFPFLCSVYCGVGHGTMRGSLIVE